MKHFYLFLISFLIFACGGTPDSNILTDGSDNTDSIVELDSFAIVKNKLNKSPENRDVLFESAKFYIRHGEVDQAKQYLEKILAKDSTDLNVQKVYGDILLAELDLAGSKYHYEYIIGKDSTQAGAFIGIGKIYALLNNSPRALLYFNEALKINPYLPEPYFMKGMVYRSDFYRTRRQEDWDVAISSFQTAVEQDPNYYSAYVQMGVMHDEVGDDKALEYYNSALDIFPESLEAWYNKGMFYQNRNEVEDALVCYREANRIDSTWADAYFNQGYIHMIKTEELDSARYYFEKATYWDPQYFQAYNNLGLTYEKMGDLDNARKYYQKAIEINPDFQLAKDNLNALQ